MVAAWYSAHVLAASSTWQVDDLVGASCWRICTCDWRPRFLSSVLSFYFSYYFRCLLLSLFYIFLSTTTLNFFYLCFCSWSCESFSDFLEVCDGLQSWSIYFLGTRIAWRCEWLVRGQIFFVYSVVEVCVWLTMVDLKWTWSITGSQWQCDRADCWFELIGWSAGMLYQLVCHPGIMRHVLRYPGIMSQGFGASGGSSLEKELISVRPVLVAMVLVWRICFGHNLPILVYFNFLYRLGVA